MTTSNDPPVTIYLQWHDDGSLHDDEFHGTTWCSDKINDGDIEYIRRDVCFRNITQHEKEWGDLVMVIANLAEASGLADFHGADRGVILEQFDPWIVLRRLTEVANAHRMDKKPTSASQKRVVDDFIKAYGAAEEHLDEHTWLIWLGIYSIGWHDALRNQRPEKDAGDSQ